MTRFFDTLKPLPVASLAIPCGGEIYAYSHQFALGRFHGKIFVVRHVFDQERGLHVPQLFETRNDALRTAKQLHADEGIQWTCVPASTAFGYISAKTAEETD